MTAYEFGEWVAYHAARFRGWGAWLAAMSERERTATMAVWAHDLRWIPPAAARAASDELHAQSVETTAPYDRHVAIVRARAKGHVRSGQSSPRRCPHCRGTGVLPVLEPDPETRAYLVTRMGEERYEERRKAGELNLAAPCECRQGGGRSGNYGC